MITTELPSLDCLVSFVEALIFAVQLSMLRWGQEFLPMPIRGRAVEVALRLKGISCRTPAFGPSSEHSNCYDQYDQLDKSEQ